MMRRVFDIIGASLGLAASAIPSLIVAPAVWASLGRPIIYKQKRLGLNKEPFLVYKFNVMSQKRAPDGTLPPDEERLTRIGWFLKRTSLDEIPQFFNVLKGEMSLVGPRPLMPHQEPKGYEDRFKVKPGITGLAQIGPNRGIDTSPAFSQDVWYARNQSLLLDLKIIFKTPAAVIRGHNAAPELSSLRPVATNSPKFKCE